MCFQQQVKQSSSERKYCLPLPKDTASLYIYTAISIAHVVIIWYYNELSLLLNLLFSLVDWGPFRNYQQHLTCLQEIGPFRKQQIADIRIISQLSKFNLTISVHSTVNYAIYGITSINRHPIFCRFLITVMLASHCVTGVGGRDHSSLSHSVK